MSKSRAFDVDYAAPDAITQQLADAYRRNEPLVKKLGLRK
jgi:hypothetical protein